MPDGAFTSHPARNRQTVSNAKLPDALRLSGLHDLCNILSLRAFVGRIRRSRRIRQEICKQSKTPRSAAFFLLFFAN
ncbi:hypothetical protein WQ68_10430 [Escherichia coli]|nr:hypothetical protein Q455_0204305 [Escherichia coli ATCC BAA-2192]KJW47134.1 hypothetical protein UN91_17385 [Escherichia coli]OMI47998.1 hypothetical protein MP34_19135 [Escherichia coli N37122PS]OMI69967.1 hypothetical protein MP32_11905 [Escherichia coli N36410PS]KLG55239.1 hypothetical protein WQ68_10430 [Escherichia coli]